MNSPTALARPLRSQHAPEDATDGQRTHGKPMSLQKTKACDTPPIVWLLPVQVTTIDID